MKLDAAYKEWVSSLKEKIRTSQLKATLTVNNELVGLYWDLGKMIAEKLAAGKWGSNLIGQVAKDLKKEFPDTSGFSRTNLFSMRQFYLFYSDSVIVQQPVGLLPDNSPIVQQAAGQIKKSKIVHQAGGQIKKPETVHPDGGQFIAGSLLGKIPWGHHVLIINKTSSFEDAVFYLKKTIENNWSRNVLQMQIENKLHKRQGKAIHNFELTLPKPQSDLATELLKDPYKFDFLTLEENIQELELEKQLTDNITQFLLELGKGFAFVGRQYPLQVGKKERKIDLLFYQTRLHCYVVIDLKTGEFEPEHAGKMNYYLSAVDDLLKTEADQPSIGIILCKSKDAIEVEYTLRDMKKPMGISEYSFSELPKEIRRNMPTLKELEKELSKLQP